MNKNHLIEQEVKEEINKLILEELTVNDDVMDSTKRLEEYIINNIENGEVVRTYNGGSQRKLNFKIDLFLFDRENIEDKRQKIKINCFVEVNCNNFVNNKYFQIYNKNHTIDTECNSVYIQGLNGISAFTKININYISVNFKPLAKFYQDIPHEINHIYQQYMERGTYNDSAKYANVATTLQSNDKNKNKIANLLYILNPTEQDSTITSVYNFVKHEYNKYETNIDNILKETEAFQQIIKAKELYTEIKNNKDTYYNLIVNDFNFKTWNIFIRRIKALIQRFEHKFAMVTKKCKNDFILYETHTFYSGNYNKFYLIN